MVKDYTYTIGCPSYLSLTGNFSLTNNDNLSVIIWLGLFMHGASEYGVSIYDENLDTTYRFYVNKDLKYLRVEEMGYTVSEEKEVQALLAEYQQDLNKMRQLVKDEWQQ